MPISTPDQIVTPWAEAGLKDTIPQTADPVNGRAGYDQGFPAINMIPKAAGGIPPFGQDFNGIFYDLTVAMQYLQAGGSFPFDGTWATAVGGYPIGALVSRSDNSGLWRNTVANNTSNPESGGAGWQPEDAGATSVTMTSSNVTLTALQAARSMIIITGALTANLQLIFPTYVKQWLVINNTTGAFTITCKTAAGTGLVAPQGASSSFYGDGTNIGGGQQAGLGTAAYADLTTSASDQTAGRIPKNGDKQVCTAWVNFNGTGTPAIRDSFNVSSITDNGTGKYAVNFATAMATADYAISCPPSGSANGTFPIFAVNYDLAAQVAPTTASFRIATQNSTGGPADFEYIYATVFGGK